MIACRGHTQWPFARAYPAAPAPAPALSFAHPALVPSTRSGIATGRGRCGGRFIPLLIPMSYPRSQNLSSRLSLTLPLSAFYLSARVSHLEVVFLCSFARRERMQSSFARAPPAAPSLAPFPPSAFRVLAVTGPPPFVSGPPRSPTGGVADGRASSTTPAPSGGARRQPPGPAQPATRPHGSNSPLDSTL